MRAYRVITPHGVFRAIRWRLTGGAHARRRRRAMVAKSWLGPRLGLQRRIMLYVAIGLAVMLGSNFIMGMRTVHRATDMVFEERLMIAQSVAARIGHELDHALRDAVEEVQDLPAIDSGALDAAARETFTHLTEADAFSFIDVTRISLLDQGGQLLASYPAGSADPDRQCATTARIRAPGEELRSLARWRGNEAGAGTVCVVLTVTNVQSSDQAELLMEAEIVASREPFVPFGVLDASARSGAIDRESPRRAEYHLEILTANGTIVGGVGLEYLPGERSEHYPMIERLMETGATDAVLHNASESEEAGDHVMAVVPVPYTDLYLALEQDTDIALALPNEFRRNLILFGTLGFIGAMLAAWFTTRRVVKPTEHLTAAAARMALGELSNPITVKAQDEIGVLAANLEVMRRQLNDALEHVATVNRELESRVKERTSQLQGLVRQVLTAQEEERNRVALELHDETAQLISALLYSLDSALRRCDRPASEEAERLREARVLAAHILEGIRRLISGLRPVALSELGLRSALRAHVEDLLGPAGVGIHIEDDTGGVELPSHVELILYRIGQEALNNVARHASCRNVWLDIACAEDNLILTIRDDGVGFDADEIGKDRLKTRAVGLIGMRERAALVGGCLEIESVTGRGTTVRVEVALDTGE